MRLHLFHMLRRPLESRGMICGRPNLEHESKQLWSFTRLSRQARRSRHGCATGLLGGRWIQVSGQASDLERFVLITWGFAVVEPPYNALAFRMNEPMPNTLKLVLRQRP